ncbi:hypothetical protein QPX48_07170 [Corynebacterium accolens]|uniref:hypothetical protein n=1 Tax=Corynebacterium accolens TaxID=38284 RepID=UPI002543CAFE|nr:hypothetical protein [Corynebacterium accolens]MDK4311561.1 hypothetical protein [Corynebacterium accolens]
MNDFLARTEEGTDALTRAVSETFADVTDPARRTPRGWRRFVYLALGESTVWSHLFGWKKTHAVTSAPLLPLLAAEAQDPTLSPALLAGAVGQAEKSRRLHHPSFLGVAGVSASHAAYSWVLYRRGARNDARGWGLRAMAWAAALLATRKQPTRTAVAVGGAAVLTTSALAGDPRLRTDATKGLSHGANLLVAAEGLTALRARLSFAESQQKTRILKKNKKQAKPTKVARVVGAAEAGAFALGHFLLVDALTR